MNTQTFLQTTQNDTLPTTNLESRYAALAAKAQQPVATIWQPEAGETLIGEIMGSEQVMHPMYGQQSQMIIKTKDGATVKVWLNRWLRDNLRGQLAETGDLVLLIFDGKKKTSAGKEFNSYQLTVDKG